MRAMDDTFAPFGGQLLVHGRAVEALEGPWAGYASDACQAILPLKTRNEVLDGAGGRCGRRASGSRPAQPDGSAR